MSTEIIFFDWNNIFGIFSLFNYKKNDAHPPRKTKIKKYNTYTTHEIPKICVCETDAPLNKAF